jgi:hypothetical protein
MGDGMMMKNVRILVAAAACVLLGMPLLAEGSTIHRNLACG